jgi:hypothetical protein
MSFVLLNDSKTGEFTLKMGTSYRSFTNRVQRLERPAPSSNDRHGDDGTATVEEMSRADLIDYARGLDIALARLTAQHVKPLSRAIKLAREGASDAQLGVTTRFEASKLDEDDYDSAFDVVFEIAKQAMRRARADREVERRFARLHPEAAATLVALRRDALRDAEDWPEAARHAYERNIVADALRHAPDDAELARMRYWACVLDRAAPGEFDSPAGASECGLDH